MGSIGDIIDTLVCRLEESSHVQIFSNLRGAPFSSVESKLQKALCSVRAAYNAQQHVNKLPPEILSRIFLQLKPKTFFLVPKPETLRGKPYRWLRPTITCRHWWHVAEACASLWTTIIWTSEREYLAETFIRRSRRAPLEVYAFRGCEIEYEEVCPGDEPFEDNLSEENLRASDLKFLRIISPQIYRLKRFQSDLDLPIGNRDFERTTASVLGSWYMGADGSREGGALSLLFGADIPALTELSLAGFCSWPHHSFHDLTRFSFAVPSAFEREPKLWNGFVEILRNSPLLEALVLSRVGRGAINDLSLLLPLPIPLIRLKILCTDIFDTSRFLTLVTVPTSTSICVTEPLWHNARHRRDNGPNRWPYPPELQEFDEIRIMGADWDSLTITGKPKSSPVPSSMVHCRSASAGSDIPATISSWTSTPGVFGIQKLFLHGDLTYGMLPNYPKRIWGEVLSGFPNLRYIRLSGYDPTDLVTYLLEDIKQGSYLELEKIRADIKELSEACQPEHCHRRVRENWKMFPVVLSGEPALARLLYGCRFDREKQSSVLYLESVITCKGFDGHEEPMPIGVRTLDELQSLNGWYQQWSEYVPFISDGSPFFHLRDEWLLG